MNVVFFSHPTFLGSQSMPRFVNMLAEGMTKRGWKVNILVPKPYLYRVPAPALIRKWLGYIDQYIFFPSLIIRKINGYPPKTLFVVTDHALGPYVPLVARHSHVIHCHDFLAQQSALGMIPENITGWTGKLYQAFIRRGYRRGRYFISVSRKTQRDLHMLLGFAPRQSEIVYNGLNPIFRPFDVASSRQLLGKRVGLSVSKGYVLHVGGNQWYKNRVGVIQIYDAWRIIQKTYLPLIMIGKKPDAKLLEAYENSVFKADIHLLVNLNDALMPTAYSGASAFLFPSLAEGFGWPIAEAMACGCPVITTNAAPMTEVAGHAGLFIPVKTEANKKDWAMQAAMVLDSAVNMKPVDREKVVEAGIVNAKRFNVEHAVDQIDKVYREVLLGDHRMKTSDAVA